MRFSIWPSPQRSWQEILDVVLHCERTGWDGAYIADHFMPNTPDGTPDDGPTLECWAVVAGLAASTDRLRLGSLVSANTYRHPAVLANAAVAVDHISGGRLVLGMGAGWQVNEHIAYGIDLFDTKTRLDRFQEACEVITSMLQGGRSTFRGEHYRITDAPNNPPPLNGRIPLLVGGRGERRTLRIAAQFADEWNVWSTPDSMRHKSSVLDKHCEEIGRDPREIRRSTQALLVMSTDEKWLKPRRARVWDRPIIIGTPREVVEVISEYAEAGVDELIVPDWTLGSPPQRRDTFDLFQAEVVPAFR